MTILRPGLARSERLHILCRIILGNDERELVFCEDDDAAVVHQPVILYGIHLLLVGRGEDVGISSVLDLSAKSLRAVEVEGHTKSCLILVHLSYLAESARQRRGSEDRQLFGLFCKSCRRSQEPGLRAVSTIHVS